MRHSGIFGDGHKATQERKARMISRPLSVLALMVGLACCATQPPTFTAGDKFAFSSQEEAGVRTTLAELDAAWNAHDIGRLHDLFVDDAQWVRSSGNIWRSRKAIYVNYEFGDQTPLLRTENVEVRPIAPEVAIAVAVMKYGEGALPSVGPVPAVHNRVSIVLGKRGSAWRILQLHEAVLLPVVEENDDLWDKAGSRRSAQGSK